jgi:hypothetical protein
LKLKYSSGVVVYMKQFLMWFTVYGAIQVLFFLAKEIFHRETLWGFDSTGIWSFALSCLIISLATTPNYFYIAKAIRIDGKDVFYKKTVGALEKMKWKLVEERESRLVFVASLRVNPWRDKIIVRFTEKELLLYGPRIYIERILQLAKFPYGAFEISNFEQAE